MDAAGLVGLARTLAWRGGQRTLAGGVAGALAAAVVGDATTSPRRQPFLRLT